MMRIICNNGENNFILKLKLILTTQDAFYI